MSDDNGRFLTEPEAIGLLAGKGVPYPEHAFVPSAQEAAAAAEGLGFPVVLKVVSPEAVHKSDLGGVEVNLADGPAVAEAFQRIVDNVRAKIPEAAIEGVLVCQQAPAGVEVIVGATRDPVFGPTVMCGLGGIFTEILKDVSFRVAPFGLLDAEEMIQELKGYPVLTGARGGPPADLEALAGLLVSVADLVDQREDILELDLNPVRVYERGLLALDARVRVGQGTKG
jgi:acyl-CoA synthetase (NDP forming)